MTANEPKALLFSDMSDEQLGQWLWDALSPRPGDIPPTVPQTGAQIAARARTKRRARRRQRCAELARRLPTILMLLAVAAVLVTASTLHP